MRLPRRAPLLAAVTVTVLLVTACGSSAGPGWTYAPAPDVTAAPSPDESPAASPAESPAASPGDSPSATQEPGPGGPTVTVVAENAERWETPELTAPADTAFTLEFDNRDPAQPHNVVIKNADGSNVDIGDTTFFTGPEVRTYDVPPLAAAEYQFICEVHPTTMIGTLTVE